MRCRPTECSVSVQDDAHVHRRDLDGLDRECGKRTVGEDDLVHMTLDSSEVRDLREQARMRATARSMTPAIAHVADVDISGTHARRYAAQVPPKSEWVAVFAHGGYFIFGDLDFQDEYCRRLAIAIEGEVLSVDYALTPEHTACDSIADVVRGVSFARERSSLSKVLLCGDSAGGAVALLAAARLRNIDASADAVFLMNPNVDLTMAWFDHTAPAGPDPELSRRAIPAWAGIGSRRFRLQPAAAEDGAPAANASGGRRYGRTSARGRGAACSPPDGGRCKLSTRPGGCRSRVHRRQDRSGSGRSRHHIAAPHRLLVSVGTIVSTTTRT